MRSPSQRASTRRHGDAARLVEGRTWAWSRRRCGTAGTPPRGRVLRAGRRRGCSRSPGSRTAGGRRSWSVRRGRPRRSPASSDGERAGAATAGEMPAHSRPSHARVGRPDAARTCRSGRSRTSSRSTCVQPAANSAHSTVCAVLSSTRQSTVGMGRHCQNTSARTTAVARTYVERSTCFGTTVVSRRLNAARAMTLCCTANNPSSSTSITTATAAPAAGPPPSTVRGTSTPARKSTA